MVSCRKLALWRKLISFLLMCYQSFIRIISAFFSFSTCYINYVCQPPLRGLNPNFCWINKLKDFSLKSPFVNSTTAQARCLQRGTLNNRIIPGQLYPYNLSSSSLTWQCKLVILRVWSLHIPHGFLSLSVTGPFLFLYVTCAAFARDYSFLIFQLELTLWGLLLLD